MNKRLMPRLRKRLALRLGEKRAFTSDVSPSGFAVELMQTLLPGATVHGALAGADGRELPFTGVVQWAKQAEPRLQVRGRAGVRLTGVDPRFFALLAALAL